MKKFSYEKYLCLSSDSDLRSVRFTRLTLLMFLLLLWALFVMLRGIPLEQGSLLVAILLSTIPLLTLAQRISIQLLALLFPFPQPSTVPNLSLERSLPEWSRAHPQTLVVFHHVLASDASVEGALEHIAMMMEGNKDNETSFLLYFDRIDSDCAYHLGDYVLDRATVSIVSAFNREGAAVGRPPLHLIVRERTWSSTQESFIGWERKRGKVLALNRALLGKKEPSLTFLVGDLRDLLKTPYVVTLDADSWIGPGAVASMVRQLHEQGIEKGYVIGQPKVTSRYQPLGTRLSNFYAQKSPRVTAFLTAEERYFGRSTFLGKGVYHVQSFNELLETAFQEDLIISHDYLEGIVAPVLPLHDISIEENQPHTFIAQSLRRERWWRGDAQVLMELLFPGIIFKASFLSKYGKRELWVRLSRMLYPINAATIGFVGAGVNPELWAFWLIILFAPTSLFQLLMELAKRLLSLVYPTWSLKTRIATFNPKVIYRSLMFSLMTLVFIPLHGSLALRALSVGAYRALISKRYCLDWVPASLLDEIQPNPFWRTWFFVIRQSYLLWFSLALFFVQTPRSMSFGLLYVVWCLGPFWVMWLEGTSPNQTFSVTTRTSSDKLRGSEVKHP